MSELLHKSNTGIASELLAAGELGRRGFNVTLTFGNTKAIDLLVEKNGKLVPIQVKGIQRTASICWNINLSTLKNESLVFVLVNLHADSLNHPEYFILTYDDVKANFKPTKSNRDYLDYNLAKKLGFQNRWEKISDLLPDEDSDFVTGSLEKEFAKTESIKTAMDLFWNGYCPESFMKGKRVRMRLNGDDFYESEETGLQIFILSGVQAVILNFRGKGEFRSTTSYGDDIENGELLSPQTTDYPPFNNGEVFQDSHEIEEFIRSLSPCLALPKKE